MRRILSLLILVSFFLALCSKKPAYYVEGKFYADDQRGLYFQAVYDIFAGRLKQAEEKLEFLVKNTDEKSLSFAPYYELAVLKLRLKKTDEAKFYAEKSTEYVSSPKEAQKLFYLFVRIGDQKRANELIDYYFSKFPSDEEIFRIIVISYIRMNDLKTVKDLCEIFISRNPDNLFALSIYGSVLKNLGDKDNARRQFEKILNLGSYDETVLKELIDIYREQKDNKRAINILKEAEKFNPSVSIKRELVDFLLEDGQSDEAVSYMDQITKEIPEPEILFDWIRVLFRAKRYKEVVSNATHVIDQMKDRRASEFILLMKAMSLHELGRFEEAYKEYDKFEKNSDFYMDAVAGKIDALREIDPEKAVRFVENIDKSTITYQVAHSIIYSYREKEDFSSALKLAEEFEKRFESKKENFIYTKAILLYESGRINDALAEAEKLLIENQSDPTYLNLKGYLLCEYVRMEFEKSGNLDIQKLEEAKDLISKAFNLKQDPYIKDSLGWYFFLKGDLDQAQKYITEALASLPDDPILNEHLGDIMLKKGENEKALELYKKSLQGKPKGIDKKRIEDKVKKLSEKFRVGRSNKGK